MTSIAIDLGATFIKAARVDPATLSVFDVERVPFPAFEAGPSTRCELDPRAVLAAVRGQLARLLASGEPCEGILFASQMHGYVLCDARGDALSPFVSWRDGRSLEPHPAGGTYFDVLESRISEADRQALGRELRPGFAVTSLFHAAETGQLPAGATPTSIADYCIGRLTGTPACCEATMASAFGTFDLGRGQFHRAMLDALGLDQLCWPALVDYREPAGRYRYGGLDIPVYASVGDQQAALLGVLLDEHELSVNVATGSQVGRIATRLAAGDHQVRPFFGRYLDTITHIPAGRALNAIFAMFAELSGGALDLGLAFERAERAARALPGTDLQVDLAFFASACGDRGAITNMHEGNMSLGHVLLASYQAMAANYATMALRLCPSMQNSRAVLSGGLVIGSELLQSLLAASLGLPMRACDTSEDVLTGLACLARVHAGHEDDVRAAVAHSRRARQATGA